MRHRSVVLVRSGFSLIELLVVIAIIGVLVGLVLPAVNASRESSRDLHCKNNLKQLGVAIHHFHDRNQTLPTYDGAFPPESFSKVYAGWFVHILPDIDQQALYDSIMQGTGGSRVVRGQQQVVIEVIPQSPDYSPAGWETIEEGQLIPAVPTEYDTTGLTYSPREGYWVPEEGRWVEVGGNIETIDFQEVEVGHTVGTDVTVEHGPRMVWEGTPRYFVVTRAAGWYNEAGQRVNPPVTRQGEPAHWEGRVQVWHDQVGTPGRTIYGSVGGVEEIQPVGGDIPFEVLTCYSDRSPVAPLTPLHTYAHNGSWSLTNYLGNFHAFTAEHYTHVGRDGNFHYKVESESAPSPLDAIQDGLSNTILFAEASRLCGRSPRFAFWTEWLPDPADYPLRPAHCFGIDYGGLDPANPSVMLGRLNTLMFQTREGMPDVCNNWTAQANHGKSLNVCMADGSVRAISNSISHRQLDDPNKPHEFHNHNPRIGRDNGTWDMLMLPNDGQLLIMELRTD